MLWPILIPLRGNKQIGAVMKHAVLTLCALGALISPIGLSPAAYAAQGAGVVVQQETTTVPETFPEQEITLSSTSAGNGERESVDVPVISWRDMPFQTVKKQALDYSCGSAALSTLLTYVYGNKTAEGAVFKAMFDSGDQKKIQREGFSLLDMSNYLNSRGYKSTGYKVGLESVEKNKIPFIALINDAGYNHFVVVKSVKGPYVLVGDPNKGNVIHPRKSFETMWNGIALVVTNNARKARSVFDNEREWKLARVIARPNESDYAGIDTNVLPSMPWQVAPSSTDLLSSIDVTSLTGVGGIQ